jgi:hypothetical protein
MRQCGRTVLENDRKKNGCWIIHKVATQDEWRSCGPLIHMIHIYYQRGRHIMDHLWSYVVETTDLMT